MKRTNYQLLVAAAKKYMKRSKDPIHDLSHATRVVAHVKKLAAAYHLSSQQTEALILAAWWHDVARSITKRPSIIIMPFIDDLISALMLWYATIRHRLFGPVAGMATRIIFCKSIGTGRVLTRLLMMKKNRLMIDILEDADTLDTIHIERTQKLFALADTSALYHLGYRLTIWWFLSTRALEMRTQAAKRYVLALLKDFLHWMREYDIMLWHRERFGQKWLNRQLIRLELFIQTIEQQVGHRAGT